MFFDSDNKVSEKEAVILNSDSDLEICGVPKHDDE